MRRFSFDADCPHCGGDLELVNAGRPILGREVTSMLRCEGCLTEWSIHMDLRPFGEFIALPGKRKRLGTAECGTDSGYARHRRNDELPCAACKKAHTTAERARALRAQRKSA